jgi:hypothetical protein
MKAHEYEIQLEHRPIIANKLSNITMEGLPTIYSFCCNYYEFLEKTYEAVFYTRLKDAKELFYNLHDLTKKIKLLDLSYGACRVYLKKLDKNGHSEIIDKIAICTPK